MPILVDPGARGVRGVTQPRSYSRTGLHALKAAINLRGLRAISGRTVAGRALIRWRKELLADLGGERAVSAQRRALVDSAVRTRLLLEHVDGWLLEQTSLVLYKRRMAVPVLAERMKLAESLARTLDQLGLDRVSRPGSALEELKARHSNGNGGDQA